MYCKTMYILRISICQLPNEPKKVYAGRNHKKLQSFTICCYTYKKHAFVVSIIKCTVNAKIPHFLAFQPVLP